MDYISQYENLKVNKGDRMRFSIIIPVYNAQNYIAECLNSILQQDYHDFEIILINDGSTDKSGEICKRYANEYEKQIVYVEQENRGQLLARVSGIRLAKGEYCCFIDSDDMVTLDYFECINSAIEKSKADIILFEIGIVNEEGKLLDVRCEELFENGMVPKTQILEKLITSRLNSMCNKAYKTTLFEGNVISDDEEIVRIGEDLLQNIPLIERANSFYFFNRKIYLYRKNYNSVSYNIRARDIMEVVITRNAVYHMMERLNLICEPYTKLFYEQYLEEIGRDLRYVSQNHAFDDLKKIYDEAHVREAQYYLKDSNVPKWKKIALRLFYEKKWKLMAMYCKCLLVAEGIYEVWSSHKVK